MASSKVTDNTDNPNNPNDPLLSPSTGQTSNLIKKFSIFDEKQAKATIETVVEVLDLNVDLEEEQEGECEHRHKIDLSIYLFTIICLRL